MRDRIPIIAGLALFLGLVTYPVWHGLMAHTVARLPALAAPTHGTQCVAPLDYMSASHMQLLMEWRREVVREGKVKYEAFNGKIYDMKFSGTCLKCHDRKAFCDRCHAYVGVRTPYCWNCHQGSSTANGGAR